MKKNVFFIIVLILSANVAVFSQTAVSVPGNFIGTWWVDGSQEANTHEYGIQFLMSIEIKRDGTWIVGIKCISYNQIGDNFLIEAGFTDGQAMIRESGYVTGATPVQIALTRVGETQVWDRLTIDGNDLLDKDRRRYTKNEPQRIRRQ